MKRSIVLEGIDGEVIKELILSKATTVRTNSQMFYLDKLKDDTWRLIYNEALIPDITKLGCLRIVREDDIEIIGNSQTNRKRYQEYLKCKESFEYFATNYIHLDLPSGSELVKESEIVDAKDIRHKMTKKLNSIAEDMKRS